MEMTSSMSWIKQKFKSVFLKEKFFFLTHQEINWKSIGKCLCVALAIALVGVLFLPEPVKDQGEFHQTAEADSMPDTNEQNPTQDAIDQMKRGRSSHVHGTLRHLYDSPSSTNPQNEQNGSMIISRGGLDSKTKVPPGSRIAVKLYERAVVSSQGMPVIGVVTQDFIHEDTIAIPQGSKLFGVAAYDDGGDQAKIDWSSIQFPDGRDRPLTAMGVSRDGQVGVSGRVHTEAIKNTVGHTLTRFVGAYAEGSMQRGSLGGNPGGDNNGWKNAIAETAKDRAELWANDLKKEKRWIEISNQTEFYAVLTSSFAFRDPGETYGR